MTSHRSSGSPRRPAGASTGGRSSRRTKQVKPPRFGPAWYKKRRFATRKRVATMSRKRRVWRRVGILGTWFLAGIAVLLVVAVFAFYQLSDVVTPDKIKTDQVATILYSDGTVMARIGAENRTDVDIRQVPEQVKWDVLAAEDRNYYSNPGISISGTLRAAWNDLTGGETQGGSGITQQYVKNAYLNADQTLSRKLKELAIAVKLDRNYSKDTILEYYLNTIYFGRGAYGIQAAARTFFGVDVSKLDVAQGAVLAALIRSPGYYDPAVNKQAATDRFHYVLDGMVATGHLTQAQADATAYPAVKPPSGSDLGATGPIGLIVNKVKDELLADGIDESELNTRGLIIQTTVNPKAQAAANTAISAAYGNVAPFQSNIKKALVAVDPNTGGVMAYWGGVNNSTDYQDYAGRTCQAPGSSFKPYTLAVGLTNALAGRSPGYSLDTLVDGSSPQTIGGTQIANDPSDAAYESSSITVRRSMEVSLNTVFDAMALAVGPDNVATMAHNAGISATCGGSPTLVDLDANGQSTGQTGFGIGIGDYPVHTMDQAVGFSTFETGGLYRPGYFVQKVTTGDGTVVFQHKDAPKRVMDPRVANDVTVSLEPVAEFSRNPLGDGRPSASKTGTVGIEYCRDGKKPEDTTSANGNCDDVGQNSSAWTVGFTPSISVASWAGSGDSTTAIYGSTNADNPADGSPKTEYGRDLPGKAWKTFTDTWLAGSAIQNLPTQTLIQGGKNTARPTYSPPPVQTSSSAPPPTAVSTPPSSPTPTPTETKTGGSSSPPPSSPPPTSPPTSPPVTTSPPGLLPGPTRGGGGGGGGGG